MQAAGVEFSLDNRDPPQPEAVPVILGWPAHPKQPSKLHVLACHAPADLMRRKGLQAGDPCSLYVTESDLRLLSMAKNANEDMKLSFDPTEYITFDDCQGDQGHLAWYTVNMEALKVVAATSRCGEAPTLLVIAAAMYWAGWG
ncbi:hypothetical protein ACK3TF_001338 [Chlorella vulgaris]